MTRRFTNSRLLYLTLPYKHSFFLLCIFDGALFVLLLLLLLVALCFSFCIFSLSFFMNTAAFKVTYIFSPYLLYLPELLCVVFYAP